MKNAVFSILAVAAAANAGKVMSTLYETEIYTITSCAPEVTQCAHTETSTVHTYTTECEETSTPYPTPAPETSTKYDTTKEHEYTISTVYETKEYTITKCGPTVTNCPVGHVTTTVVESTTLCPVEPTKSPHNPYPSSEESPHVPYPTKPAEESPYVPYPTKPAEESPHVPYSTKSVEGPHNPYPSSSSEESPYVPVPTTPAEEIPHAPYPTKPTEEGPHYSTIVVETCVPTTITKVITVTGEGPKPTKPADETSVCPGGPYCPDVTTSKGPYPTGGAIPTGGYGYPPKNETVDFHGSASTQRAGGLLLAVGLAAVALF